MRMKAVSIGSSLSAYLERFVTDGPGLAPGKRAAAGWSAGFSHHERSRKLYMTRPELLAGDETEKHVDGHLADFDQRLVNGCQRRRHLGGVHDVVEADDAHLIGDADVVLVEDLVDARCLRVVAGKDRGGRIWLSEQMAGLLDAIAKQVGAFADQGGINRDARALERLAVAGQARAGSGEVEREGDDADPSMPKGDQILGSSVAAKPDGRSDGRKSRGGFIAIADRDKRNSLRHQGIGETDLLKGEQEQHAVGGLIEQAAQPQTLARLLLIGGEDDEAVAALFERVLDAVHDSNVVAALETHDHQVDQVALSFP